MKFYGTENETFVETAKGIFLIQAPDGSLVAEYEEINALPEDATELDPNRNPDLYDLVPVALKPVEDIHATAASLFDGGWRASDRAEMIEEYTLTPEEADKIIELFEKWSVDNG